MILFDLNRTLPIKIYIKINLFYIIIMNIIRGLSLIMGQQAELYICVYIYEIQQSIYKINIIILLLNSDCIKSLKKCPKQRRKLF